MKSRRLLAFSVVLLLLFLLNEGQCERDYIGYQVQINNDSSASWTIVLVSDIDATIDRWESFQQKIFALVFAAGNVTNREMAIEPETIQMETVIVWETQAKTTEFRFRWLNFSTFEDGRLVLGDVFGSESFFGTLYGDGTLKIIYPVEYSLLEVSPSPDRQDNDYRTLEWFRSQDFLNGKPKMILTENSASIIGNGWTQYAILGLMLAGVSVGVYFLWRRKTKRKMSTIFPTEEVLLESDEEKVTKFIRLSGGGIYQSNIGKQFGFSKAKTSQLLSSLERKGVVVRYKRGRDKIIDLIERTTGDKS